MRRLFFCLLLAPSLLVAGPETSLCKPDRIDRQARVSFVADGDTVRLDSGEWIRFIGINTPETGHDGKPGEPLAGAARERLRSLLGQHDMTVALRLGTDHYDRHGRLLAHVFLPDNTNVTRQLIADGLGYHIVVPPNTWGIDCYRSAEQLAAHENRGIWGHPWFAPRASDSLPGTARGFMRVRGKVVRIGRSKKNSWINLEGRVAMKLANRDLQAFKDLDLDSLVGRTVTVRGWFYPVNGKHDDLRTNLRHPAALEVH